MPQQFDPTAVDYIQRTDPPSETIYFDKGRAIMCGKMCLELGVTVDVFEEQKNMFT